MKRIIVILFLMIFGLSEGALCQRASSSSTFTIARIKYHGGGDWYNDPSIIPNLLKFMKEHTNIDVAEDEKKVEIMDEQLFSFPVVFMTGHGKIQFSEEEAQRLRKYLTSGGFLYADDDYGMDKFFRQEIKKVFPDKDLVELPFSHPIYHCHFDFPNGVPKTHEHDGGPPHAYGIFHKGRMVVYYTFNTNISDGWADPQVHGDPPEKRLEALKMGTNIMVYALMN
ncbi:MAG: DUF4159 domain-containing protein [candidate division KSB1 bacterium]|nr:DUF4159 domain-containing protein [candidate division KSB1 bacterium]